MNIGPSNTGQLGPYEIEAELGQGGMATVYRAFHVPLRRYVALKVLDSLLSRNAEFQQRFEQEARVAARLEHPNIVAIYDLGMADGRQYIAMRLIEGPTLEQVIRDGGPMPAQRALAIIAELADALAYAHEQGVYHRDVKPSNVMLRANDRPTLTDFGIARAVEGLRLTMSQSIVGTPRYMSPEQALAQPVDHRSDIYSLGVILYEMLGGQAPFSAPSTPALLYMHVHESPPPLTQLRPGLSPGVRELVERCLAKSPDERFQSAAQVAASCRALLAIPSLDAAGETMQIPAQRPPSAPTPSQPGGTPSTSGAGSSWPRELRPGGGGPTPPPAQPRMPSDPGWAGAASAAGVVRPPTPPPMGAPVAGAATPAPAAPAAPPAGPARVLGLPLPVLGGIVAGLVLLAGLVAVAGDRVFNGTAAAPTPTVRPLAPTAAPTVAAKPAPAASPGAGQPAAPVASPSPAAVASPGASSGAAAQSLADATAALGRRDWAAALEQANAGLRLEPRNTDLARAAVQARLGLADQLWSRGSLREALTHLLVVREQPLRAAASPAQLREAELGAPYLWGELTWDTDLSLALVEFEKVYRRDPGYKEVRNKVYTANITLANQAMGRNDRDAALRYANAARAIDPNRSEANELLRTLTPTPTPR